MFKPRIGSVSSCSGDGSARGATEILAPAHLIAAALAKISGFNGWCGWSSRLSEELPDDNLKSAKDFRNRWDTLTSNDCVRSGFDIRGSVIGGFDGVEIEEGGGVVELGGV